MHLQITYILYCTVQNRKVVKVDIFCIIGSQVPVHQLRVLPVQCQALHQACRRLRSSGKFNSIFNISLIASFETVPHSAKKMRRITRYFQY
jgi:ABC-type antimicrobial peptide transport system permease subunit